jgi:hypothetical protein
MINKERPHVKKMQPAANSRFMGDVARSCVYWHYTAIDKRQGWVCSFINVGFMRARIAVCQPGV